MRVMLINSSIEFVHIWTIADSLSNTLSGGYPQLSLVILGYPSGYLMIIISDRDCRRFLKETGKIIANAQTISHIFESYITRITKDNQREPSENTGNYMETVRKFLKTIFRYVRTQ